MGLPHRSSARQDLRHINSHQCEKSRFLGPITGMHPTSCTASQSQALRITTGGLEDPLSEYRDMADLCSFVPPRFEKLHRRGCASSRSSAATNYGHQQGPDAELLVIELVNHYVNSTCAIRPYQGESEEPFHFAQTGAALAPEPWEGFFGQDEHDFEAGGARASKIVSLGNVLPDPWTTLKLLLR